MRSALAIILFASLAAAESKPTPAEAKKFLDEANERELSLTNEAGRAAWIQSNFITDDTETLAALANERQIAASVEFAKRATRFDKLKLQPDMARQMKLLKLSLTLAAPSNAKEREELTKLAASLEGTYGKGKYCPAGVSGSIQVPRSRGHHQNHHQQPRSKTAPRHLDRLAHHLAAHEKGLRAPRGTGQQGRA